MKRTRVCLTKECSNDYRDVLISPWRRLHTYTGVNLPSRFGLCRLDSSGYFSTLSKLCTGSQYLISDSIGSKGKTSNWKHVVPFSFSKFIENLFILKYFLCKFLCFGRRVFGQLKEKGSSLNNFIIIRKYD